MENVQTVSNNPSRGEIAINIVELLTWYPLFFAISSLVGSYFKWDPFIMFIMPTWMIAFYIGSLLWLILIIWLLVRKIISMKKTLIYFLIAAVGIVISFLVWSYDFFNYGFKYIDY